MHGTDGVYFFPISVNLYKMLLQLYMNSDKWIHTVKCMIVLNSLGLILPDLLSGDTP